MVHGLHGRHHGTAGAAGLKERSPLGTDISPHGVRSQACRQRLRQSSASWFVDEYRSLELGNIGSDLGPVLCVTEGRSLSTSTYAGAAQQQSKRTQATATGAIERDRRALFDCLPAPVRVQELLPCSAPPGTRWLCLLGTHIWLVELFPASRRTSRRHGTPAEPVAQDARREPGYRG